MNDKDFNDFINEITQEYGLSESQVKDLKIEFKDIAESMDIVDKVNLYPYVEMVLSDIGVTAKDTGIKDTGIEDVRETFGRQSIEIKIFYPFKPEEPGRTHAHWFMEFMNKEFKSIGSKDRVVMVDNAADADFVFARYWKDPKTGKETPPGKLMGNPFGHQPNNRAIIQTKDLDETEKLYKAWLNGNLEDVLTPEQYKKFKEVKVSPYVDLDYDMDKKLSYVIAMKLDQIEEGLPLKKIISGLQKNVDQAGIRAAIDLGLDYGGTVNNPGGKGYLVVPQGKNIFDLKDYQESGKWIEIDSKNYPERTISNARNADGTVWFGNINEDSTGYNVTKDSVVNPKNFIENPTSLE